MVKKSGSKSERRRRKLTKRLKADLGELLDLALVEGDLTPESLGVLLKGMGNALIETEHVQGESKRLRKAGRFLAHLHDQHQRVIEEGQFAQEEHDQRLLDRVRKMARKGREPKEIARKLRKEGERITADGIRRVLAEEAPGMVPEAEDQAG